MILDKTLYVDDTSGARRRLLSNHEDRWPEASSKLQESLDLKDFADTKNRRFPLALPFLYSALKNKITIIIIHSLPLYTSILSRQKDRVKIPETPPCNRAIRLFYSLFEVYEHRGLSIGGLAFLFFFMVR